MKKLENLKLSDEQLQAVSEILNNIEAKHNKLIEENESLKSQIADRDSLIGEFEKNKMNVEELTKQIETFKQMEEKYKSEIEDNKLNDLVRGVIDKHSYVNEITKKGLFGDLKNALKNTDNVGKSAEELFLKITKDMTNIFKDKESRDIPKLVINPVKNSSCSEKLYSKEELKNMSAYDINKNWDLVSESLKEVK